MTVSIATFTSEDNLRAWELESDGTLLQRDRESVGSMWSPPETAATLQRRRGEAEADLAVIKDDARKIELRKVNGTISIIGAPGLHDALAVFILDPVLRSLLELVDPKAVEQAREALLLT